MAQQFRSWKVANFIKILEGWQLFYWPRLKGNYRSIFRKDNAWGRTCPNRVQLVFHGSVFIFIAYVITYIVPMVTFMTNNLVVQMLWPMHMTSATRMVFTPLVNPNAFKGDLGIDIKRLIIPNITPPSTTHSGHSQAVMTCSDNEREIFLSLANLKST